MKPRILFYDIETTPNEGLTWGVWQQNVLHIIKEWQLLCFAYKWAGSKKIEYVRVGKDGSDKKIVERLLRLFNEADIIIAHNGDEFDQKKARTRFLKYDLTPPPSFATVDTLKVVRNKFALPQNNLDYVAQFLKIGRKVVHHGKELWLGCMANDEKSWRVMEKYNKRDVELLEKVYYKLRPWMTNHPNLSLLIGARSGCPACGSSNTQLRGTAVTHRSKKQRNQCQDCASWFLTPLKKGA